MNENTKRVTMSIIGEDGSIDEVEVVIAFEFKDTKKEYNHPHSVLLILKS